MNQHKNKLRAGSGLAVLLSLTLAACGGGGGGGTDVVTAPPPAAPEFPGLPAPQPETPTPNAEPTVKLSLLSSPADRVMGTTALVQLELLKFDADARLRVTANGADVSHLFRADAATGFFLGNVEGLREGANEVVATYGAYSTKLALTGYPRTGPVFSGPHMEPFVCGFGSFTRLGGGTIVSLEDGKCSGRTLVSYFYRNTSGGNTGFNPATATAYPANMAYVTVNGKQVPFLVRLESGTVNRTVYQSAILHDALNEPVPSPASRPAGWNGKLVYTTMGGCGASGNQQGNDFITLINPDYMAQGYAAVSSTLNNAAFNCNDVLAAESVMAVKEQFAKSYGQPTYTVGFANTTGDGAQPLQVADNYPGLFDGVITTQTLPDTTTGLLMKLFDARLLNNFFNANAAAWTTAQRLAVTGFRTIGNVAGHSTEANRMDPLLAANYPAALPVADRYDPVNNRSGVRATPFDAAKNVWGVNAEGHALRPLDNTGVQYGLKALNDGAITVDQFLTLNEQVGGLDRDFQPQAARTEGDLPAIERGYKSGRILNGGGGLAATPVIERRNYVDGSTNLHMRVHSFSLRERLLKANGNVDNHVILSQGGIIAAPEPLAAMDAWLMGVLTDTTAGRTRAEKVAAARPADLKDACWVGTTKTEEVQTAFGASTCNTSFPSGRTPRMVAGGPLADDVVKCQLKPVDAADYTVAFTPAEWTRLQAAFPAGVCDWSKPGVGQQPLAGTWLSFGPASANLVFDITRP
ncbi:hypothetical protein H8N03_17895 [Ramlibacter sp. USB13]|uniref:DUF6351 domain-containing protein n=1 Tax=Ramlibacter cellulosilyticus TaxID=2764187 RepID=A0A923SD04_9BURK|nr:DUF6351 family protein [Ramlibacter cellulosilyticus]MBC5784828.1 hypothetical protein [Ramlibacter cellulosilyticus]